MLSIIIPAHNEETVLARGLRTILAGAAPRELEVIVACNGCTDRTAEIARSFAPAVRVLDVPVASKITALNAADEVATGFPRFYVDADVVIDLQSIRHMASELERGAALMVNPSLQMDFSFASRLVRAYYRVWTALPYNNTSGMVGTGVYAVSHSGRQRWGRFPDLISDDGFVRFCFAPHERSSVSGAVSRVDPPRTMASLCRIKTRSRLGLYQLRSRLPHRPTTDRRKGSGLFGFLFHHPRMLASLPVYMVVNCVAKLRARFQFRRPAALIWERDDSGRPSQSGPSRRPAPDRS